MRGERESAPRGSSSNVPAVSTSLRARAHQTSSRLFVSGSSSYATPRQKQTSFNSRTTVFQTDDGGAIPPVCTARAQAWVYEPILWRGSPAATRRPRVRFPLGSLQTTLGS